MKQKLSKNKLFVGLFTVLFLGVIVLSTPTLAETTYTVPLQDHISLTTYANTAVDSSVTKTDWMLSGNYWYSTMHESIWASDGESSAGVGTSYISLEDSCLLGDYASEPGSWADFAYIKASYSSTITATGSAFTVGTNATAPSLSAGTTSSYISCQVAGDNSAGAAATATWTSDIWSDIDGDGVDDSSTVPEEDFLHFSSTKYVYGVMKVDGSDTDKFCNGFITLGFYVDSSTTYDVTIEVNGGSDDASAYTSSWTYTGATSAELDFYEAEGHAIAFCFSIAELISDDTDSTPNISGLDWIKMGIEEEAAYGDGSSDTVDFYLYNLCILDELPAITDNNPSANIDSTLTGGANNAAQGDGSTYLSHDVLVPYIAAATANAWTTKVYLDNDLHYGTYLNNHWRHVKFEGTARLDPYSIVVDTPRGSFGGPNLRTVEQSYLFNQLRRYDSDDIVSTYAPSYSAQVFKIKTDNDDFYSPEKEYDEDFLVASVNSVDKIEDFKAAIANQNDNTWVTMYTFSSVTTEGSVPIYYEYNTEEQGGIKPSGITPFDWAPVGGTGLAVVGLLALIGIIIYARRKKN